MQLSIGTFILDSSLLAMKSEEHAQDCHLNLGIAAQISMMK